VGAICARDMVAVGGAPTRAVSPLQGVVVACVRPMEGGCVAVSKGVEKQHGIVVAYVQHMEAGSAAATRVAPSRQSLEDYVLPMGVGGDVSMRVAIRLHVAVEVGVSRMEAESAATRRAAISSLREAVACVSPMVEGGGAGRWAVRRQHLVTQGSARSTRASKLPCRQPRR